MQDKTNELQIFLEKARVKTVYLNEHCCIMIICKIFLLHKIPNFNLAASYCRRSSRGGSTCILVHSSFEYIVRHETDTLADDFIF